MELQKVLEETVELVKSVGGFIREEGRNFDRSNIEKKGFNDLVSYVDKQAEEKLVKGLSQFVPEAGFITEEGTAQDKGEAYKWIIDPLDGTTNFLHSLPVFSVSVALMHENELILGVVYEINLDECFYARKGGKAYCNGKEIKVSPIESLSEGLVATGFPYYDFEKMQAYMDIMSQFMKSSHGLRRLGSAAVDLIYVAIGRFEGFYEYNLNSYDLAGGAFIVQQAGGKVTDWKGGNDYIFGRELLATNGKVHEEALKIIQDRWGND